MIGAGRDPRITGSLVIDRYLTSLNNHQYSHRVIKMANVTEDICAAVNVGLVEDILKTDYGFINGKIRNLDGYDDKNYHITVCIYVKTNEKK